jgi:putative ATPase
MATPLAERMRPRSLDELVGQAHLTGSGSILRTALEQKKVPSMILWGPPGVGKTTIAQIISEQLGCPNYQLSAINSGVKEVREAIEKAKNEPQAILFIDEIHRFNKVQQDALLGAVEKGSIILIGATTENPSFEINSALLSRCQIYVLKSLDKEALLPLLTQALSKDKALQEEKVKLAETEALLQYSGGDARKLLNLFELVIQATTPGADGTKIITDEQVQAVAQRKMLLYDKQGEQHYDIVSAFIKSIRGSDPNGAVYWLARMIDGGEELSFIARRLLILASEDIGNANPNAILMAHTCYEAVEKIGYPESRIILSQCAIYLASSVKSNRSYQAIGKAQALVAQTGNLPVPLHLRNAPTKMMKQMGYGQDYQYAHEYPDQFSQQEYLPTEIQGSTFYEPGDNAREQEMKKFLSLRWKGKYGY